MKRVVAYIFILLLCNVKSLAQAGFPDSTFNGTGYVNSYLSATGFTNSNAFSSVIQANGKIVSYGNANPFGNGMYPVVIRYNSNGTVDSSFGTNGLIQITTLHTGYVVVNKNLAIQPDGKILLAGAIGLTGQEDYSIIRLNQNGSIDSTFGTNGQVITNIFNADLCYQLIVQPNGKILALGRSEYTFAISVVRYNSNGSLDLSFANNGKFLKIDTLPNGNINFYHFCNALLQPDGKIVLCGNQYSLTHPLFVLRLNANGSYDNSFGINGLITFTVFGIWDYAYKIMRQSSGKLVIVGYSQDSTSSFNYYCLIARFNTNGTLDNSFNNGLGYFISNFGYPNLNLDFDPNFGCLQSDDKIVGCIQLTDTVLLVRNNADGTLDSTFGINGISKQKPGNHKVIYNDLTLQPDDKIILSGYSTVVIYDEFTVWRFNNDISTGVINFETGISNELNPFIYPNPIQNEETLEYTLTKNETISINLYNINGQLEQTFFTNQLKSKGAQHEKLFFNILLKQGSYFLKISNKEEAFCVKIIKQ